MLQQRVKQEAAAEANRQAEEARLEAEKKAEEAEQKAALAEAERQVKEKEAEIQVNKSVGPCLFHASHISHPFMRLLTQRLRDEADQQKAQALADAERQAEEQGMTKVTVDTAEGQAEVT